MKLYSDWEYLQQEFDCSFPDRFLMALRAFDNRRSVCPFLVERGDRRFGLFLHVEKGNVEAAQLPPDIQPVYYQPYFNFDDDDPGCYATLEDALESVADGEHKIRVDRQFPLGLVRRVSRRFDLIIEPAAHPGPVFVRHIPRMRILERHAKHRPSAAAIACRLLERSPYRDELRLRMNGIADKRFDRLDAQLGQAGAAAVIVTSGINMQEIGAIPMRGRHAPVAVLYRPGEDIVVIERGRLPGHLGFPSLAKALDHLTPDGILLVEEDDLTCGIADEGALFSRETRPADFELRRWRDHITAADLPFYVITTRASRTAIDAALDFVSRKVAAGDALTEMDAYDVYRGSLREFFAGNVSGFRVARTLTNFHSTTRTSFPSNPAPYPLSPQATALKVDAGCLIVGEEGMMLGCSDIARTLCFDEAGQSLLDYFQRGVQQVLIPACRTGATGADIFRRAVEFVDRAESSLHGNPLFRRIGGSPRDYDRDVGHLLGRNNLAHLRFTSDEFGILEDGMIACCEYQWPVGRHAIAFEDTCVVTDDGGLNITSDEIETVQ